MLDGQKLASGVVTLMLASVAQIGDAVGNDTVPKSGVGIIVESEGANGGVVALGYRTASFYSGVTAQFSLDYAKAGLPPDGMVGTMVRWAVGALVAPSLYASHDSRTELVGRIGFGLGGITAANDSATVDSTLLTFEGGIGMNYWLDPQFAIGGHVGISGWVEGSDFTMATVKTSAGFHAMFVF